MKRQLMVLVLCGWLGVVLSTPPPTQLIGVIVQAGVTMMALFTLANYIKGD